MIAIPSAPAPPSRHTVSFFYGSSQPLRNSRGATSSLWVIAEICRAARRAAQYNTCARIEAVNTERVRRMSEDDAEPRLAKIDVHGYRPRDFVGPPMSAIVEQAWAMGADKLRFIHGHGRARGKSPGFYNTKTGWLGLRIRRELRRNRSLRQWIKYSTLDCGKWGQTTVKLKDNPHPTRRELDLSVLPERAYPR